MLMTLDIANVLDLHEGSAISCLRLLCFSICIFPTLLVLLHGWITGALFYLWSLAINSTRSVTVK